jgi:hypothetical protein
MADGSANMNGGSPQAVTGRQTCLGDGLTGPAHRLRTARPLSPIPTPSSGYLTAALGSLADPGAALHVVAKQAFDRDAAPAPDANDLRANARPASRVGEPDAVARPLSLRRICGAWPRTGCHGQEHAEDARERYDKPLTGPRLAVRRIWPLVVDLVI